MEGVTNKSDRLWICLMTLGARLGCHQRPERSFFLKGYQFPVCARCTGIIASQPVAIILFLLGMRLNLFVAALLLVPMALDGGLQYLGCFESTNTRRVVTGFVGCFGLTFLYCQGILYIMKFFAEL